MTKTKVPATDETVAPEAPTPEVTTPEAPDTGIDGIHGIDLPAVQRLVTLIEQNLYYSPHLVKRLEASDGLVLTGPDDAAPYWYVVELAGLTARGKPGPSVAMRNWCAKARRSLMMAGLAPVTPE